MMAYTVHKLYIRDGLMRRAADAAKAKGMSLDLFIDYALEEKLARGRPAGARLPHIDMEDTIGQQLKIQALNGDDYDNALAEIIGFIRRECRAQRVTQRAVAAAAGCRSWRTFGAYLSLARDPPLEYMVAAVMALGGRIVVEGKQAKVVRNSAGDSEAQTPGGA